MQISGKVNCSFLGKSVRGAAHINIGKECQDSLKQATLNSGYIVVAVADGHGSEKCPYSKTGSQIAVNAFKNIMEIICEGYGDEDELRNYLLEYGDFRVAKEIERQWKEHVLRAHRRSGRQTLLTETGKKDKTAIYKLYGTTLLGVLITGSFIFSFQLGDGDILITSDRIIEPLIKTDRILGVYTDSLCQENAWEKASTSIINIEDSNLPLMISISSDGFSNSYQNDKEFYVTIRDYFDLIKEHGADEISKHLSNWLKETSTEGCGDDITAAFVMIEE